MRICSALILLVCACCQDAKPTDLYLVNTIKSYHLNRAIEHNENNFGLGLEYHIHPDVYLIGGFYDNSYNRNTTYGGGMYMPFERSGFRAGMMAVLASGYESHLVLIAAPMFSYEYRHVGVNFMALIAPSRRGVLGAQVKYRF